MSTRGRLQVRWTARVDDCAIDAAWIDGGGAVAVLDGGGGVHVLEGPTGRPRWSVEEAHASGGLALSADPRGGRFATSGLDGRVRIWRSDTADAPTVLSFPEPWVSAVQWSDDGHWLAAAAGRRVRVWDAGGTQVLDRTDQPSSVSALAFGPVDELAVAAFGEVRILTLPEGTLTQTLAWKGSLVSLVLSPDGGVVACGSQDNTVHFWRRASGRDSMMSGYPRKPSALAFDATGSWLATGGSESVMLWSFADGGPEGTAPVVLDLHTGPITSLAFTPRGLGLASGGRDGHVGLWVRDARGAWQLHGHARVDAPVEALRWSPGEATLAGVDADGGVHVWSTGR